jgi:hypothetical protein
LMIRLTMWNILHLFRHLMQLPVSHDDWNVAGDCEGWECHDPNQSVHTPTTNHLHHHDTAPLTHSYSVVSYCAYTPPRACDRSGFHTQCRREGCKRGLWQRFGENVCQIFFGWHVFKFDSTIFHFFSYIVVMNIDMASTTAVIRLSRYFDASPDCHHELYTEDLLLAWHFPAF